MKLNPIAIACASVLVSQVAVSAADDTDSAAAYGVGEFGVLVAGVGDAKWSLFHMYVV